MLKIRKDEIPFDYEVKDRLDFICKYSNRDARFFNSYVVSFDRTNLHYVEPHKLVIRNHLFLLLLFLLYQAYWLLKKCNLKIKTKTALWQFF